ncbi:MAG TPA: M15 family metallopeptidase [bacterium]|nr:M15 family metallopeptidase [bacterium]HNT64866.1 M15 family metallopeptidase [bacterium]HOX84966.1 M15 family metallopeptidase [bacterium]HPG44168.1 M15 family metallopeptidase [bacterium]HPM96535.1 M15 family metallopeptidase [bacterium]
MIRSLAPVCISLLVLLSCFTLQPDPMDLVDVCEMDSTILVELAYATPNNFLGQAVYSSGDRCILRRFAAERLVRAHQSLRKQGYGLKVLDAYRPLSVQEQMWAILPDSRYVADPAKGSRHNRGAAVDVTLVDLAGNDVEMPTAFDEFSEKAASNYADLPRAALHHRSLLQQAMQEQGFSPISSEWWHFDAPGWEKCKVLDISLQAVEVN